jgi:DNA-directed RNA polymerase specialized sigma24 family protein
VTSYLTYVRAAVAVTGSEEHGREAVHDAFVGLFSRPRLLRDPERADAYLRRAVIRAAQGSGRRRRRLRQHEVFQGEHGGSSHSRERNLRATSST